MSDQAENANDRYERLAAQFYRDTGGIMAPGKDAPAAMGGGVRTDPECRRLLWDLWMRLRSHTAPRELVEAVKAMILLVEDYEAKTCKVIRAAITIGKSDWQAEAKERELAMHRMFEFLDVLRSALSAQEPKVCEWTRTNNHSDGTWLTGCGKEYFVRTFTRVGYSEGTTLVQPKHCPDCGSPIKVKE